MRDPGYRARVQRLKEERAALEVERAALIRPGRLVEIAARFGLVPVDASRVVAPTRAPTVTP